MFLSFKKLYIEITKEKTSDILTILIQVFKFLVLWTVCFEVYYLNSDGYISREEIFDMLKNSLHQQSSEEETDEGIKELVDITLKKMVRMKTYNLLYPIKQMLEKAKDKEMIYFPL